MQKGLAVSRVMPNKIKLKDGTEIKMPKLLFAPVKCDTTISLQVWYEDEKEARNAGQKI